MLAIENIVFAVFTVLSGALLTISYLAYRKRKNRRMLLLTLVFLLFFIKGLVITASLFFELLDIYWLVVVFGGFDCLAVLVLYFSTLKV